MIWILLLLASCESHRLRTMTIGFDDCELIFSVHDRCKQIDEEQIFVFTFQSDHSGVRFSQDNLTLSAKDFSLEAAQGCHYTKEYRIGYRADPSPVPEFQWRMTTAEDIATFIPMYSLNPQGLNDLVKILLGYPFPMGVNLHG